MRLPLLALFLISSRLFADAVALADCGNTVVTDSDTGGANAFCSTQNTFASSSVIFGPGSGHIQVFQAGARGEASATAIAVLLITGGTGIGTYKLLATGKPNADEADLGYVNVQLGDTRYYRDDTGFERGMECRSTERITWQR